MTEEFNKWWDNDLLTQNNPYVDGTPAFWAWEGWRAGVKAEREACAELVYNSPPSDEYESQLKAVYDAIRARGTHEI
jgi:hypothetical protein